ncbi:MAG: hypothetical protein HY752_03685 [Nitrospirae bacterium]|nr:hypothetical protein [Nitrospirota bacterium]
MSSDNRQRLWIYTFTLGTKTSGNNKSTNITFTPPTDAKEPGKYMLVFRGKIGNEEDAVVGKEIMPLVFLIYQDAQNNPVYAVWSIENSGKKLVSYDFDISKYTTYFNIYNYRNSSVVKSDDNYQNHVYTIENLRIDNEYFQPGYNNGYPQYGRRLQSTNLLPTDKMIAIGVRNCFINGIFDYDTSYLNYPLGDASNYICSGRHSAYMDEKKKWIKNLSLWKINTNSGQIKYETENGWENGSVISYQKQSDIYAVLSPDKYIGLQSIGNGINYDIFWIEWNLQGYWWQKCRFFLDEVSNFYEVIQVNGLEGYHNIAINPAIGAFKKFVFGDTILEDKLSERVVEGEHESYRQLSKSVNVMDYDNVNIDETFICIYFTSSGRNYWYVRTWDGYYPECNTSGTVIYYGHDNWHSLTLKEYVLSYKIKDKELVKITTGYFTSGIYVTPGPFYNTSRNEGQRLSGVSTQATDKYLLYTYMLWTYSGPSNEDHFNDLDDTYWTFNKRILGIIDIETGTRTDHEVNDELLGQYKDTFDKTLPSAIGFHNGSVKKEE